MPSLGSAAAVPERQGVGIELYIESKLKYIYICGGDLYV